MPVTSPSVSKRRSSHLFFSSSLFFLLALLSDLISDISRTRAPFFVGGGGTTLRSPVYNLLPADLRTPPAVSLEPLLISAGTSAAGGDGPLLSPELPTLLLFECVLAYMTPAASNALIQWFVDYFAAPGTGGSGGALGAVVYEMFKLNDPFGRVMLNNLKVRALSILRASIPHPPPHDRAVPRSSPHPLNDLIDTE